MCGLMRASCNSPPRAWAVGHRRQLCMGADACGRGPCSMAAVHLELYATADDLHAYPHRRWAVVLTDECPLDARLETGVGLSFFLSFTGNGRKTESWESCARGVNGLGRGAPGGRQGSRKAQVAGLWRLRPRVQGGPNVLCAAREQSDDRTPVLMERRTSIELLRVGLWMRLAIPQRAQPSHHELRL
jgi:hypothetical protein